MSVGLRTAPCPRCQTLVVFGEPQCRGCAQVFDYGPTPPPIPTPEQVREAVLGAQLFDAPSPPVVQARAELVEVIPELEVTPLPPEATSPSASSATEPTMEGLDLGRYDDVGAVVTESVEGFIDSSLFARYTPDTVDAPLIEGLESSSLAAEGVGEVAAEAMEGLDTGRFEEAGTVVTESIEGFIDSSLFARFTPETVETESVPDLELNPSEAAARPFKTAGPALGEDAFVPCSQCGTPTAGTRCPACGSRVEHEA